MSTRRRAEAAALALALLAGCAGPRPEPPAAAAVTPPAAWRGAAPSEGDVQARWWEAFGDPGLSRLVDSALANNVDVALAAARLEELAAQARLAQAQRLPEVDGGFGKQRERSINPAFGVPELQTASEWVLQASYDVDLFGRLRQADAAARATLLATRAAQADVRLAVAAGAARGWFALRALDARLATLRATLEARRATLRVVGRRAGAGYASKLELAQAEAEEQATAQQLPATELAIRRAEDALCVLLGDTPHAIERGGAPGATLPGVPAALPSALLRRRPDIVEAEERVVAADRALDAARAAFMPDVKLAASFGEARSSLLPSNPIDVWSFGASVLAPLLDAGRLKAQEDAVAARRDAAAFAYRRTALKAFAEVEDALAATEHARAQHEALAAERGALERALALAQRRYRAGYASFLEQLDAQRQLLAVELALAQSDADRHDAAVALFQALGGGWDGS